jgi:hypothetical protein
MLCIFNGKVTEIEVKQPPEGLHFGAAFSGDNAYAKYHLRKLTPAAEAGGKSINNSVSIYRCETGRNEW